MTRTPINGSAILVSLVSACITWPVKNKMSFCHKLWFLNHFFSTTQDSRPQICQIMNSVRLNNNKFEILNLNIIISQNIGIRLFEFRAKTKLLSWFLNQWKKPCYIFEIPRLVGYDSSYWYKYAFWIIICHVKGKAFKG